MQLLSASGLELVIDTERVFSSTDGLRQVRTFALGMKGVRGVLASAATARCTSADGNSLIMTFQPLYTTLPSFNDRCLSVWQEHQWRSAELQHSSPRFCRRHRAPDCVPSMPSCVSSYHFHPEAEAIATVTPGK